jgi:lipoprotein-anchoring transpeptidase ErfK/SrfK
MCRSIIAAGATALAIGISLSPANAQPLALFGSAYQAPPPFDRSLREEPEADEAAGMPAHLRRQVVPYNSREAAGTIVIDTANTYLYYVLGNGRAIRYGIGVGREGFTWSGVKAIGRKAEWPDWVPPQEMIARQPYLPRFMAGGPGNPMGARAMYLGESLYRIHGTNDPSSIGKRVSSGCIRMLNEDVIDLYERTRVGAKVVVQQDVRDRSPQRALARQRVPADFSSARRSDGGML